MAVGVLVTVAVGVSVTVGVTEAVGVAVSTGAPNLGQAVPQAVSSMRQIVASIAQIYLRAPGDTPL